MCSELRTLYKLARINLRQQSCDREETFRFIITIIIININGRKFLSLSLFPSPFLFLFWWRLVLVCGRVCLVMITFPSQLSPMRCYAVLWRKNCCAFFAEHKYAWDDGTFWLKTSRIRINDGVRVWNTNKFVSAPSERKTEWVSERGKKWIHVWMYESLILSH